MNTEPVACFSTAREMKDADFDRERAEIRQTYGDNARESSGLADQALARLFYRSHWTQERLAAKEGCTQSHAAKRLRFGLFLQNSSTELIPKNLTERRFRKFWERTDREQKEARRFAHVVELLQQTETHAPRRLGLTKHILDKFGDGKWHNVETLAAHVDEPLDAMREVLANLKQQKCVGLCESRKHGKHVQYRLQKARRTIDYDILIQEIRPHLDALKIEGKKSAAYATPVEVAHIVIKIERMLKGLAEKTSQKR